MALEGLRLIRYGTAKREVIATRQKYYLSSLGVQGSVEAINIKTLVVSPFKKTTWRHLKKKHRSKSVAEEYGIRVINRYREKLWIAMAEEGDEAQLSDGP